jgi:hypothetical protein
MTEEQMQKYKKWLRLKYGNNDGEDVFQQAYMIAIQRYGIEKINQSLFGKICREAARQLQYAEKHEIPFSYLVTENQDQTDEVEYDPEDPEWRKDFDAIESREEIEKTYGNWLLNALLKATTEPPKNMVTTDRTIYEKQMKFEFA